MKTRGVIFDLDGTLLDSIEDIADSMNVVLEKMGLPHHPLRAYRYFVGNGMDVLVHRALPQDRRDEGTERDTLQAVRREYGRRWSRKTRPYEGIPELLDRLSARGVPMAVFSNKPDDFTKTMVARLLPRWRFQRVLGAGGDFPKKPDPAGAVHIAKEMSVPADSVFYTGDTAVDMKTARGAGMCAVGVLWGFREREELEEAGARVLIERPQELLELL